jgi:hypothetical protein
LEDKDQLTLEEIAALEAEAVEQVKGEGGQVIPENDDDLPF